MPPTTRKVSGGRQATLSFNHRVTKASVTRQSAKEAALLQAKKVEKVEEKDEGNELEDKKAKVEAEDEAEVEEEDDEKEEEGEEEEDDKKATQQVKEAPTAARPQAEIKADAVTDAQVRRYWRAIEAEGMSRRVHQEGLDLAEKVLRHFDVSSQFGPCVGITRKTRWARAQRLGLAPPIEVLAVMLQEEAKGVEGVQTSSFDDILNAPVEA